MYVAFSFVNFYISKTLIKERRGNGFQVETVTFLFWNESLDTLLENAY